MLQIAPTKVGQIIVLAREFDAKVSPWDDNSAEEREGDMTSILEATSNDPVVVQLTSYIDNLNEDEQVSLVALMWVGRGTFESEELAEAISTARSERVNKTSAYLLGVPLLSDYLEDGLDKLGYSVEESEADSL